MAVRLEGQRASVWAIVCLVAGLVQLLWTLHQFQPAVVDFPMLRDTAGRLWRHLEPPYIAYPLSAHAVTTNTNLPHTHLLLGPLPWLPMPAARWIWRVVNGAALVSAIRLVRRDLPLGWWAAIAWCGGGTVLMLLLGQIGLLAVCVSLAWLAVRQQRWERAAAWLAVLAMVKPFAGLFVLWLLWRRQWRAVLVAAAVGLAVLALGVLTFGTSAYVAWFETLQRTGTEYAANGYNVSWQGVVARLGLSSAWRYLGWVLIGGVTWWRLPRLSDEQQLLLVLVAAMVLAPVAWAHYLCLLAGPLVAWVHERGRLPRLAWLLWIPAPVIEVSPWVLPAAVDISSAYALGFGAIWSALAFERPPARMNQ